MPCSREVKKHKKNYFIVNVNDELYDPGSDPLRTTNASLSLMILSIIGIFLSVIR
jgi:hypothetical protein